MVLILLKLISYNLIFSKNIDLFFGERYFEPGCNNAIKLLLRRTLQLQQTD